MCVRIDRGCKGFRLCLKCSVLELCRRPRLASFLRAGRKRLCRHGRQCRLRLDMRRIICADSCRRYRAVILCPLIRRLAPAVAGSRNNNLLIRERYCCCRSISRRKTLATAFTVTGPILNISIFRAGRCFSLCMTALAIKMAKRLCISVLLNGNCCISDFFEQIYIRGRSS